MPFSFADTILPEPVLPPCGCCGTHDRFALVVHGGAQSTDDTRKIELGWLTELLRNGQTLLADGATALDTVVWAVRMMEMTGLFNAGAGAIPNRDGIRELDAAVMDGRGRRAGAVASVVDVLSPVQAARWVMDETNVILLAGPSAEIALGFSPASRIATASAATAPSYGTVGAVALDRNGDLAAATSSGGRGAKVPGRVGDSPIIGAGTWADNATVAVSCTGDGEHFVRGAIAHDVHARMAYQGISVDAAVEGVIRDILCPSGGEGGLIAVDRRGDYAWAFNSKGMIRGAVNQRGEPIVAVT